MLCRMLVDLLYKCGDKDVNGYRKVPGCFGIILSFVKIGLLVATRFSDFVVSYCKNPDSVNKLFSK